MSKRVISELVPSAPALLAFFEVVFPKVPNVLSIMSLIGEWRNLNPSRILLLRHIRMSLHALHLLIG